MKKYYLMPLMLLLSVYASEHALERRDVLNLSAQAAVGPAAETSRGPEEESYPPVTLQKSSLLQGNADSAAPFKPEDIVLEILTEKMLVDMEIHDLRSWCYTMMLDKDQIKEVMKRRRTVKNRIYKQTSRAKRKRTTEDENLEEDN